MNADNANVCMSLRRLSNWNRQSRQFASGNVRPVKPVPGSDSKVANEWRIKKKTPQQSNGAGIDSNQGFRGRALATKDPTPAS
jgi:hypothetical protein